MPRGSTRTPTIPLLALCPGCDINLWENEDAKVALMAADPRWAWPSPQFEFRCDCGTRTYVVLEASHLRLLSTRDRWLFQRRTGGLHLHV